jgi:hypothetical protein
MRDINRVIVHCLATPDYALHDIETDFGIEHCRKWHVEENGWSDVGYHRIIRRTGEIDVGRNIKDIGAHCKGHNYDSIGIAFAGTFKPTWPQVQAMIYMYREFKNLYSLDEDDWYGHNEFTEKKVCPGFDMKMLKLLFTNCELS